MGTVVKSKLVFKDIGNPARVKDHNEETLMLGTIMGQADGIKIAKGADGMTEFKGLKGTFEGIPTDPERDTVRSGVAFLGDAFQSDIIALLESEDRPELVAFAFEVYAVKAKNPAGYSWALKPLLTAKATDPLAELKAAIAAESKPAIAAPEKK